jgi:phage I-like protein
MRQRAEVIRIAHSPLMDVSSHTLSLPAGEGVPQWLHLIPAGTFSGLDGKTFHLRDPAAVIAASMGAGKLPVDENHSTQRAPDSGAPSPARAWIVEMENRADGIWGRPEWNESGTALMTDKSYKGLSPVFTHTKDGTVVRILSAALTNNPNLTQLTALHTSGDKMDKLAICTALGIAATVPDDALLAALHTARETGTALQTAQARVTTLEGEIAELKRTTVPVSKVVELETSLNTLKADAAQAKAVAFVDAAIKLGKPITATRDEYIAMHVANPVNAEKIINGLPSLKTTGAGNTVVALNDAGDGDGLSAEDMAICTRMGTDPKKYAENLKKMKAKNEGSAV